MSDPSGYWGIPLLAAGALIGMGIGVAAEVMRQVVSKEKFTMKSIAKIGVAAVAGALGGVLMASGVGYFGAITGNALINAGSGILNNAIDNKKSTISSVGKDAVIGGASGFIGGRGAQYQVTKNVMFPTTKYAYTELTKESKKIVIKELHKATAKSGITAIANMARDDNFRSNISSKFYTDKSKNQYLGDVIQIM